jgi:C4-dicarboxylate transporter DctM subunit
LSALAIGVIGVIALMILLFSGVPVGIVMALVGFVGTLTILGVPGALGVLKTVPYSTVASYSMSVVPLFVLMGQFALKAEISTDLYSAAYKWLGHVPGGLAVASIVSCAAFSAVCGSSAATTATIGAVAMPEMKKMNYKPGFAAACLAVGGTLGIMIPPSTAFILYGVIAEQSIGKLFIAGIIPGILLATLYSLATVILVKRNPSLAPTGQHASWSERFRSIRSTVPMVLLFLFIMLGILLGWFTANEAGGMGAAGAFLIMVFRRRFTIRRLFESLTETIATSAMVFVILIGAYIFSYFLTLSGLPQLVAQFFTGLEVSRYIILIGVLLVYLVLGVIMDELAMLVITTPIFLPIIVGLGFNPIWYGVMMVISMMQGQLTPPIGITLYIIAATDKDVLLSDVFKYVAPYLAVLIIFMFVLILFPQLALFLPNLMAG